MQSPSDPIIADLQRIVNELPPGSEDRTAAQHAVDLLAVTFRDHPSAAFKALEANP